LKNKQLGYAWLDTGTHGSLLDAGNFEIDVFAQVVTEDIMREDLEISRKLAK